MPLITKSCKQCSVDFSGPAFQMRKRTFCSHDCYVESRTQDLRGIRFGRLVAVKPVAYKKWESICDCGNIAISQTQSLVSGKSNSCGCLQREASAKRSFRHGLHGTKAYIKWDAMIQRCTNSKLKQFCDYGGRGITVDPSWMDFANFVADMGQPPEGMSLERVNNNLGYSKENCVWATRSQQQRNRRANRLFTHNGETKCLADWAEFFGIDRALASNRICTLKWSFEEAVGLSKRTPEPRKYIRSDAHWVEFGGRRMILSAWCRELGINSKTVYTRMMRGATDLEALGFTTRHQAQPEQLQAPQRCSLA